MSKKQNLIKNNPNPTTEAQLSYLRFVAWLIAQDIIDKEQLRPATADGQDGTRGHHHRHLLPPPGSDEGP